MKVTWQAGDIRGGRIIGKADRAERWMIGYIVDKGTDRYVLVSMSDGMITLPAPAEMLAAELTKSGELPAELLT